MAADEDDRKEGADKSDPLYDPGRPLTPAEKRKRLFRSRRFLLNDWRGLPEERPVGANQRPVGDLLPGIMEKLGFAARFREEEIASAWAEIVGPFTAAHSRPLKLSKFKILSIAVTQPAILYSLDRAKKDILTRLQERFGAAAIKDIRFQAG